MRLGFVASCNIPFYDSQFCLIVNCLSRNQGRNLLVVNETGFVVYFVVLLHYVTEARKILYGIRMRYVTLVWHGGIHLKIVFVEI